MRLSLSLSKCLLGCVIFCALAFSANAETTIKDSLNDVTFGQKEIKTGEESRAELSNSGGTIRVGANSTVGFRPSEEKTLDLQKGVMMVSTAKKGFGRQSVTVETDEIRATANATMIISYQPRRYIKVVCTEGKVKIALKNVAKESVTIRKGQMLIINCLENVLPGAVSVDMNQLMRTSPLFAPSLRGGPARVAGAGGLANNGRPPNSPNGDRAAAPQQRAQQGPPPGANRGLRLPNFAARPQANNLAIRRVDCAVNRNAPECRTAPRPAQNAMTNAGGNMGGGGSNTNGGGNMGGGGNTNGGNMGGGGPNMPPPNPPPPPPGR